MFAGVKCEVDAEMGMTSSLKYCPEKTLSLVEKSKAIQKLYKELKLMDGRTASNQTTAQNVQYISGSLQNLEIHDVSLAITQKYNQSGGNEEFTSLTQMAVNSKTITSSFSSDFPPASRSSDTSTATHIYLQTAHMESLALNVRSAVMPLQPDGRLAVSCMMRPPTPLSKSKTLMEIIALPNGSFQLDLQNSIRVHITLDRAIRVSHKDNLFDIAFVNSGAKVAVMHQNGRAFGVSGVTGTTHVVTFDTLGQNKNIYFTKITKSEISFKNVKTDESFSLVEDKLQAKDVTFEDLSFNITQRLFDESILRNSSIDINQSNKIFEKATHQRAPNGTEIYKINGFLIKQSKRTGLTITNNLLSIEINPSNEGIVLSSGRFHCKVSSMDFFIRQDNKRILHSHYNESKFVVRNEEASAGFKEGVFYGPEGEQLID